MPRYFFHLRNTEKALLDCAGMVLSGPEAACQEARKTVQDFFQPATGRVAAEWEGWSLEVRDERGRCILLIAFADAEKLQGSADEVRQVDISPNVVPLDVVRIKRELASLEAQTRDLLRQTSLLVDRNRYEAKTLYHLMQAAGEARQQSAELVARSREQTAGGGKAKQGKGVR